MSYHSSFKRAVNALPFLDEGHSKAKRFLNGQTYPEQFFKVRFYEGYFTFETPSFLLTEMERRVPKVFYHRGAKAWCAEQKYYSHFLKFTVDCKKNFLAQNSEREQSIYKFHD